MHTIVEEIQEAVERLGLAPSALVQLSQSDSDRIYTIALNRFVGPEDRRWWWEAFSTTGASLPFTSGDGWRYLPSIVPNSSEPVWFIAEDDHLPQYPVFETSADIASKVIGECFGFEYYLIAKDFSWLVCETHHNVVCAVGPSVEGRLRKLAVQPLAAADGFAAR